MMAVQIARVGGPEVLTLMEARVPAPGPSQVLVEVEAAGVAYADLMMRRGIYPGGPQVPFAPGYDVVGRVVAVGSGVSGAPGVVDGLSVPGLAVGQRVASLTVTGGYATHCLAPAALTVPVPEDLAAPEVVALVLNYVTARQLLLRIAGLSRGDTVVALGAAGGVGTAVLELGALEGIRVIGVASGDRAGAVRERGGVAVDRSAGDWAAAVRQLAPDGVDAVLDPVGGPSLTRSRGLVRRGGVVASYGAAFAVGQGVGLTRTVLRHAAALGRANLTPGSATRLYVIAGGKGYADKHPDEFREDLSLLIGELAAGRLAPVVTTLPLASAAQAHELLESGTVVGKLVLLP